MFYFLIAVWLVEKCKKTNVIVYGLTQTEIEPTIVRTWEKHSNDYATKVLCSGLK
jgi:hypothetical protein